MKITAGVIGCGNISKFHFWALEKMGVRVKWICDLNESAARPWVEKFKAAYTRDYRQIIADAEVNTVFILVISSLHKAMCIEAINAGKAVICEKTLAENAEDALEIVTLAEKKQTIFYTSYMKRFIPAVVKARELMPSLGKIMSMYIRTYQPWGTDVWGDKIPETGWLSVPPGGKSVVVKLYGGGILVCGGSHILDLTGFFMGRPARLYASMIQPEGADYDIQATALLETPKGAVHWEALAHPCTRIGFLNDGWDESVEISGTKGRLTILSAKWDEVLIKSSVLVHQDDVAGTATEYKYAPISPFERADEFYLKNIENGIQGNQSRLTGYDVDELISHIKKSALTKQALEVKWRI